MGGALSIANNDINSTLSQALTATVSTDINQQSQTAIGNIQKANNVQGCTINFATQNATALAVSNFTSSVSSTENLSQTMQQQIQEAAAATNTGLQADLASISDASNTANLYNQMAITSMQNFTTNCSSSASGFNIESVSNCVDSTINFASQTVSVQNLATCTANITAQTTIAQTMQQILDLQAAATNNGIDIMQIFVILMVIVLVLFLGGKQTLQKGIQQRFQSDDVKKCRELNEAGAGAPCDSKPAFALRSPNSTRVVVFLILAGVFLITWVVLMVVQNWWPVPFSPKSPACTTPAQNVAGNITYSSLSNTGLKNTHNPVNYYAYFQASCTGNPGTYSSCTGNDVFYTGCGLWGGGCDDQLFLQQKANWEQVQLACAQFGLAFSTKLSSCSQPDILNYILLSQQDCPGGGQDCFVYSGCTQCTSGPNSGFFLANPLVGSVDCNQSINHNIYLAANDTGQVCPVWTGPQTPAPPQCVSTANGLSTGDCSNSGYQSRMFLYLQLKYNCEQVLALSPDPTIKDPNSVCTLPVTAFLTNSDGSPACDPTTNLCTYTGSSTKTAACKNDYSGCINQNYQGDLNVAQNWNSICTATYSNYYEYGIPVGVFMLLGMVLSLICAVVCYVRIPKDIEDQAKKQADLYAKTMAMPADLKPKPNPAGSAIVVIGVVVVIVLGIVVYISNQGTAGESQGLTIMIVFIVLALIGAGLFAGYLAYNYSKAKLEAQRALAKEKIELQEFQTAEYTTLAIASETGQIRQATSTRERKYSENTNVNKSYNYGMPAAPAGVFGPVAETAPIGPGAPIPPKPPPGLYVAPPGALVEPRRGFIGRNNTLYGPNISPIGEGGKPVRRNKPIKLGEERKGPAPVRRNLFIIPVPPPPTTPPPP